MCFGGFPFAGQGATGFNLLNVTSEQQMPLTLHSGDQYWPLINAVLNNPMYKRMYIAHARTILSENILNSQYQADAAALQTLVDTAVLSDANKFFTYSDFQNGMTANVVVGSYTVPGITNLMSARAAYLQGTTEFSYTPPVIASVTPSNSSPLINSTVIITANVSNTNSNAVYLGYRYHVSEKFSRVLMYDDGGHNDGGAGDNVYGADITVLSAQTQFYIYAENNDAGMFSPERAEHEFHTLNTNILTASPGQVVINEFLAFNVNDSLNETGQHQDWIELYNNTSSALDLFGLYLTDDFLNPQKFAFPENTIIPANGYRIIWADENNSTASYVHCNFRLSAAGEQLMLSNNSSAVIDSITFGVLGPDTSLARCPNGTGSFDLRIPTFNAINCPVGIEENSFISSAIIYPNPASNFLRVKFLHPQKNNFLKIYAASGHEVFASATASPEETIDLSNFSEGFYLLRINHSESYKLQIIR
jgi:hypothetical protein